MDKKVFMAAIVAAVIFGGLISVGSMPFGTAQTSTPVNGIISSSTTWTKANSPYIFSGPVAVNSGVTLTVDSGVTVDIGLFYLQVNGTLNAQGSSTDNVIFLSGSINQLDANSGCTINNAILNKTSIISSKGTSTSINNCILEDGAELDLSGSSTVTNNYISGRIFVRGSSLVSNNTILKGIDAGGSYTISGNTITNNAGPWVINAGESGTISSNTISGGTTAGINLAGTATIENNSIVNNQLGISIRTKESLTIQNNTILNSRYYGIAGVFPNQNIIYNNIQSNTYNLNIGGPLGVNVANNWWGTTDTQAINQSIYDFKNDYNLGTVDFIPFLSAPNSQAPAIPKPTPLLTPIPSPSPSPSPSPTPLASSSPEITLEPTPTAHDIQAENFAPIIIILALIALGAVSGLLVYLKRRGAKRE